MGNKTINMTSKLSHIIDYKSIKTDSDKNRILSVLYNELKKFDFEDDYLQEGKLEVVNSSEIKFHTCNLENFTDNRQIHVAKQPNMFSVAFSKKQVSEFNAWDYNLSFKKEFLNSEDEHIIEASHHAIGCVTCNQKGKIRCSSCRGSGENTCSSCSGRGEFKCSSCSGRGESKCWSCSGKGTKETGFGDNKRIERCSSCSGRGYKPCSSCINGFVKCSSCSSRGRVKCYKCRGSGEINCFHCDGYQSMDNYFVVNAKFINSQKRLFLTNPFPGFDSLKANNLNFSIQNKLFEFQENRFKEDYFEPIKTHHLFRQISTFFDFKNTNSSKLISSRISFYENTYFEVIFSFYGENYTIFFDQNLDKSYYSGKKPSDQYELDLLNKSLKSAYKNELDVTKKTIEKLSKYGYININEQYIISAIEDTKHIYAAKNEINTRDYNNAEKSLKLVSDEKKSEADYQRLIKQLNQTYFKNTFIIGILCSIVIFLKILDETGQTIFWNSLISLVIIGSSFYTNSIKRSINWSRWFILILFVIQFAGLIYFEKPDYIKRIQGKWVVEDAKLNLSTESQKDSSMLMIAGMMEGIIQQMKGNATIEFAKEGKMTRTFGGQPEVGTWKISDDGNKIITGSPGSPKKDTATLELKTDDNLSLTTSSKEASFILLLKRKKTN
jgi:hypothetical protein